MKAKFVTLGCKVNQYETQALRESLGTRGIHEAGDGPNDFVVLNTCTVTADADRENRYWVRRLRRENPGAKIVVTGCWVQRNAKEVEALSGVDLVLSNEEKPDLADRLLEGCATPEIQNLSVRSRNVYGPLQISSFPGHGRAFIKIQDGCNHACSFCKVVLARGRSRSRSLSEIVDEAKRLRDSGFREIVLTGIQLGAYGMDLSPAVIARSPEEGQRPFYGATKQSARLQIASATPGGLAMTNVNLISVLETLSSIAGIERVRLSSIEPTDVKPDLIQAMKSLPKVCPQLHIPLQSGDDEILKRMNRRYGRDFYLDLVARLREEVPDFCLSMDVMAGFPGEEEPHFQNTLDLLQMTRPIRVHAFPYSRRPGTKAAAFENLPAFVLRERMNRLAVLTKEVSSREKEKFLGRSVSVLVEKQSEDGFYQGHTPHYLKVYFQAGSQGLGEKVSVKLQSLWKDGLLGRREGALG